MKRWLPFPLVFLCLVAMWLLLNATLAAADVLLGIMLGAAGALLLARLQAPLGRVRRRATTAAVLAWLMFLDIVRSNIAVARIAWHPRIRNRTSGFLSMPLEVRHPGALAVLACIVTATPGTSWARYDAARNVLTLHVLDLIDEQAWIAQFKERYERRLLEIFR
jgi:multicomponent K+:H+ antiporter subunit E